MGVLFCFSTCLVNILSVDTVIINTEEYIVISRVSELTQFCNNHHDHSSHIPDNIVRDQSASQLGNAYQRISSTLPPHLYHSEAVAFFFCSE